MLIYRNNVEVDNDWARINCLVVSSSGDTSVMLTSEDLQKNLPRLPTASSFIQERGITTSGINLNLVVVVIVVVES